VRFAIWSVVLAVVAVGIALLAHQSDGYVVIVAAPYRVELSLNLLLVLAFAGYFAFHLLARLVETLAAIPARVRAWRAGRTRTRERQALNDALLAYFQGRYASAEKAASLAMEGEESRAGAAIIAARSAHELGRFTEREAFLEQARGSTPEIDQARLTTLADLLLSQGRHEEALAVLKDLSGRDARNLRLLRMRLAAETAVRRWDDVLATATALEKLGGLSEAQAGASRRAAHLGNLKIKAQDAAALTAYWKQIPSELRVDSSIAATAVRYHLALGGTSEAQAIVESALEADWDAGLVALYADCAGASALPLIERAEKWLRAHARDPALLLALGKLCMHQDLWGKSQSYIEASLALEPTHEGHMTLAALMERLGKPQEAFRHFRRSAELAG
jgi:HemY protein